MYVRRIFQEKSNKNYYSHTEANGTLSDFSVQAIKFNCSLITWVKFITWHGREVVGIKQQHLNTSSKLCNKVLSFDHLMISKEKKFSWCSYSIGQQGVTIFRKTSLQAYLGLKTQIIWHDSGTEVVKQLLVSIHLLAMFASAP